MENNLRAIAIPAEQNSAPSSLKHEEPQGDLEQVIAQFWRDVFKVERVGRNDNFFELGGNSLLGMDLSEMLSTRLDLDVPVITIFQHPTIAEIAEVITSQ